MDDGWYWTRRWDEATNWQVVRVADGRVFMVGFKMAACAIGEWMEHHALLPLPEPTPKTWTELRQTAKAVHKL